ncbi:MAG: ATP-binding protein [Porticoccaceae bacterium]
MTSIRLFLVAVILAIIMLFNFLAAIHGYRSSMHKADQLFDKLLLETAELISNIQTENPVTTIDHTSNMAFQVWKGNTLIATSSNAPPTPIAPLSLGFDYNNFNGYRWRTVAHHDPSKGYWVLVAERTDLRFTLAESVISESIFPILMGIPIAGILIWFIVSHGLKPLRSLAKALGEKQSHDLSPIRLGSPKQELEQIIDSTNLLLERLKSSLTREKQFASDAAHELRSPISAFKIQLYNIAQQLPKGNEDLIELSASADRLAHLVEQLLSLYRSTPDQYIAQLNPIDLSALTQEILAKAFPRMEEKNQHLEFDGVASTVLGDSFGLTTLLQNLLSNANKYTPNGGNIKVSLTQNQSEAILTVEDSGPGIAPEHRDRIFERFYRVDGDRHQSGESGCGLGLSIVKHIIELHGASITVASSSFLTGTAFRVKFPLVKSNFVDATGRLPL